MIETPIIPRVSETDGAGHINNTVIPIWFEGGRTEIFRLLTPDLQFRNWRVALVNMNVDTWRKPTFRKGRWCGRGLPRSATRASRSTKNCGKVTGSVRAARPLTFISTMMRRRPNRCPKKSAVHCRRTFVEGKNIREERLSSVFRS